MRRNERTCQAGGVDHGLALGGPEKGGNRDDAVLHLRPLGRRLGDALCIVQDACLRTTTLLPDELN